MFTDFVLNGVSHGDVAQQLAGCRFDPGMLRPYFDEKGRKCVTINTGETKYNHETNQIEPVRKKALISDLQARGINSPVFNVTSLRKDEWLMLDRVIQKAARQRLLAWSDLAAANTFGGFNGMSKMVLEHEVMTDPGEAIVDMDGITEGRTDEPRFTLEGLPLPITHSDFWFSSRRLAVSRNSGTPLDSTMGEAAGRRVAEMIEKVTIGTETGVTYGSSSDYGGTSKVYGYRNHPNVITKSDLTASASFVPGTFVNEVLAMKELARAQNFFGPFVLYYSTSWDQYLDRDYVVGTAAQGYTTANRTVRQRVEMINGISKVQMLDFYTSTDELLLVQMTPDVARAVNGMDITTVQWESVGGMRLNFKVMAIMVPQIRYRFVGQSTSTKATGIVYGTTS